ncbi:MAG: ArdC-like ssDNA-binding domain-containing protein [Candidatus Dormiibacterota bacterium]
MAVASSPARRAPIGGDRHGAKTELLDQLARGVLELTSAQSWTRWLRISRRFHKYSFQNQILILRQRPEATWVAGYRTWVSLGRQVRQGERAIRILAPCLAPQDSLEGQELPAPVLIGFRIARVFDLSQTSGEALPEPVKTLSGSGSPRDLAQLGQRALCLGFQVQFTSLWGSRNGDCSHALRRIRVRSDLPAAHQIKTLAHELAHALLHGPEFQGSRALAELEAESVAYLVCQELGVDSSEYSFGYVATWSGGGPEAARLISATGGRILRGRNAVLGWPQ